MVEIAFFAEKESLAGIVDSSKALDEEGGIATSAAAAALWSQS